MKKNSSSGVIIIHSPVPVSLLKPQDVKDASQSRKILSQPSSRARSCSNIRSGKRKETSRQERLSHTSLRRLQAKMEAENQQMKEIIQPLMDTENTFMKELQSFLDQRDVTELRRKELLHKSWTEHVWFPLQRRVDEHLSSCGKMEAERQQSLYRNYLQHCNSKGFVFLETYNLKEYNPFLLSIKKPNYFKLRTAALKDPFHLHLRETQQERKTSSPHEAESQSESVTSHIDEVSSSTQSPAEDEAEQENWSYRFDTIELYISAAATSDGHLQSSCCSSTCHQ